MFLSLALKLYILIFHAGLHAMILFLIKILEKIPIVVKDANIIIGSVLIIEHEVLNVVISWSTSCGKKWQIPLKNDHNPMMKIERA